MTSGRPTATPSRLTSLANRVRGEVRLGLHDRMLYSTDASIYQVEPVGVVIPADLDDAAAVVTACAGLGLPILPRGGGTSLAGQCVNEAVVLDMSAMCRGVATIDVSQRYCRAEAGCTIDGLNAELTSTGLFFAPDPATIKQATIGGCIGNNAAGSRSIKYGRTSENVLGVDVCLADGRRVPLRADAGEQDRIALSLAGRVIEVVSAHAGLIRERFPRTKRRNAGYQLDMILDQIEAGATPEMLNLAPLVCGSEGTLAVTLSAELKLHPVPAASGLAVVAFPSIDDAIDAVLPMLGLGPSAVELLDAMLLDFARENIEQRRHVELLPGGGRAGAVLYVEFQSAAGLDEIESRLADVRGMFDPASVACHTDPASMEQAWTLRKAGEPLLHGIMGSRKPVGFIEDAAVPPERLGEYVRRLREIIEREGTRASFFAHASVGVLHVRPLLDLREEADRSAMERIALASADLARELGGVMSGEHGDGRARGPLLERFYGPELMGAFREIKAIFDPENRLNPGNIVEPGGIGTIHARTRITAGRTPVHEGGHRDASCEPRAQARGAGGGPKTPRARARGSQESAGSFETYFDFSDQGGLGHAAAMCNGAGVCRKTSDGVMCPSYRATLDERHSTRGRGNALRLAITGQSVESVWSDPETMATLDLCLSCKACKSECPSNVDVAKLKAEYLAQGYRVSGRVPLRARVIGHVHEMNRIAGVWPGLANVGMRLGRGVLNRVLGLHPGRSLPGFERPLHKRWDSFPSPVADGGGAERSVAEGVSPGSVDVARPKTPSDPASRRAHLPRRRRGRREKPAVLLYADTFTTYNEPGVGLAARRVLEAFGYRVELFRGSDAGRAMISVGMLGEAIGRADRETRELLPRLDDVEAVLFLEPSCLSAVRDDWLSLKCETPLADRGRVAERSFLVEQFLDERWDVHPCNPYSSPVADGGGGPAVRRGRRGSSYRQHVTEQETDRPCNIFLHAHCHQKALWGADSSAALLERLFPGRVRVLDTTCCGLAGGFGYAKERFDLSMRIGELGVLPATREMKPGDVLVAPGTSCRHQIRDGTGVRAVHAVELVDGLFNEGT